MEIDKRILPDKMIPVDLYCDSLVNLCESMIYELQNQLIEEGRFKGLAKSYINSMWDTLSSIKSEISIEEEDIYERVIYLFKDIISREFVSLHRKKLSYGDCIIVILKRILEITTESAPKDYEYTKKIKTLCKLINKFFDNIKNRKKGSKLFQLSDNIKYCLSFGYIGKYRIKKINFPILEEESGKMMKVLDNPGSRLEDKITVKEISWLDEN